MPGRRVVHLRQSGYRGGVRKILPTAAVAVALTACGFADPYLYRPGEFNREAADFNTEPTDVSIVAICHNRALTSADIVSSMADERCEAFGKSAVFLSNSFGDCPIATPTLARFDCVAD